MKEFEVTCINKPQRQSTHEHITHIGNSAGNWRMTREDAIRRIEGQTERYFTVDRPTGNRVYIGVVRDGVHAPYLRTHADNKWNDNLLALAECNGTCNLIG